MDWRRKRVLKIVLIFILIGLAIFSYLYNGINLGLDLAGGAQIVLEAQDTPQRKVTPDTMQTVKQIIENRVNELGLKEPRIQLEGERRIIVTLPEVDNPSEAIKTIGRTALLTFRNAQGEVLMTGEYLIDARPDYGGQFNQPVIRFKLNEEGAKVFVNITREYIGKRIGIYLDEDLITNPVVQSEIRGGEGIITGYQTLEEASEHAVLLREGALPVPLRREKELVVGPVLGQVAIEKSLHAGLIGLALVIIFMLFYYRFPGIIAGLALAIYGILVLGIMAGLHAVLTLPGIAGLILSIGMAVDANIIIFERVKEELRNKKTVKAAIDSGFKRAYRTIIDANLTTLITAAILAYFTSGTVRGFAITLGIGVVTSMFSAIFITRNIMDLFYNFKILGGPEAFGVRR